MNPLQKGGGVMDTSHLADEILMKTGALLRLGLKKKTNSFVHGEGFILNYLYDKGAGALPSELSAAMQSSSARVAMALKNLESKGLIERRPDQKDRRRVIVTLTPLGKEDVVTGRARVNRRMQRVVEAVGEEKAREFLSILREMLDAIAQMEAEQHEI